MQSCAIAPIAIATIPESTAHLYQISLYVDQLAAELGRPPVKLSRFIGFNLICDGLGDASTASWVAAPVPTTARTTR